MLRVYLSYLEDLVVPTHGFRILQPSLFVPPFVLGTVQESLDGYSQLRISFPGLRQDRTGPSQVNKMQPYLVSPFCHKDASRPDSA